MEPAKLAEWRASSTGWAYCRVRVVWASKAEFTDKVLLWRGPLPSCAPYFEYTADVKFLTFRAAKLQCVAPAGGLDKIGVDLRLDKNAFTLRNKEFMLEEAKSRDPSLSAADLQRRRGQLRALSRLSQFRKLDWVRQSCDLFRQGKESSIARFFPYQKARIRRIPFDKLEKCLTNFMRKQPWLLMFGRWSKEIFGLKELALGKCNLLRNHHHLEAPLAVRVAMRFYKFVKKQREKYGHTVFARTKMQQAFVAQTENRTDVIYFDAAYDYLKYRAFYIFPDDPSHFCLHKDRAVAVRAISGISRIQAQAAFNAPQPRDGDDLPAKLHELTEEQETAVAHVAESWITLIMGSPGHGKSETIVALVRAYACVLVVSFVGMPVDVLQKRLGGYEHVYTIHYVYFRTKFAQDGDDWIAQFDFIIIDEGSNLDVALFSNFISTVTAGAPICRLVVVGDLGQINPIKPGAPFATLASLYPDACFYLTRNLRVDPDAFTLADACIKIKANRLDEIDFSTSALSLVPRTTMEDVLNRELRVQAYEMLNFQVLTLLKKERNRINLYVETWLIEHGIVHVPPNAPRIRGNFWLYPGKKIMFMKNTKASAPNPEKGKAACGYSSVRNGEIGEIETATKVRDSRDVVVTLRHSKKRVLIGDHEGAVSPNDVDLGYATTCNKAQGSEWQHVLFWIHENPSDFWSREFAYVAESRAKRSCKIVGTHDELQHMCAREAPPRDSLLRYLCMAQTTSADTSSSSTGTGPGPTVDTKEAAD